MSLRIPGLILLELVDQLALISDNPTMWNRRQFMCRGLGMAGMFGSGWMLLGQEAQRENLARGMITPAAQEAIDAGLRFLAANQSADGAFGTNNQRGNVAITALGGLAFMAGGHQPGRGPYGRVVRRALDYVLNREDPRTPGFLVNQQAALHGPMYGHGFGTLFLAEAHGMVQDAELRRKLRDVLERAVELIIKSQNREGGWRYRPVAADADLSVTICQIMALRAARNAGLTVPKTVADKCIKYVEDCQDHSGGFHYQRQAGRPGFARTAAGIVALFSAGQYEGEPVQRGLRYLKQYQPGQQRGLFFDPEAKLHYYYGHYYAAQAMWIAGGDYWRNWFPAIRDELVTGPHRQADGSWWDRQHWCPHYCTAMALIILQIPNNYLPILQR